MTDRTVPKRERPSWAYWLGCEEAAFDAPGLKLIRNERLDKAATVIVLSTPNGAFVSIPARGYERYEAKLAATLAGKHLVALGDVINALGDDVRQVGYILWQGSLDPASFSPRSDQRVRKLLAEDLQGLRGLQEACHPTEWSHSCLNDTFDCTYGVVEQGKVVAAAHYLMLRPDLASIGVLTNPAYRGAGFAGAVVSAAAQQALSQGHKVHYQTLLENYPSIALAGKLGFSQFGLSVQVRLHPGE